MGVVLEGRETDIDDFAVLSFVNIAVEEARTGFYLCEEIANVRPSAVGG
jgi:hypothetical protein